MARRSLESRRVGGRSDLIAKALTAAVGLITGYAVHRRSEDLVAFILAHRAVVDVETGVIDRVLDTNGLTRVHIDPTLCKTACAVAARCD